MLWWQAIVLGLIQGLTEFLPVSSSGHLVLFNKWFGISDNFIFLSVILHVSTLLAVVIVLRKECFSVLKHPFSPLSKKIFIATIPTIIIALLFKSVLKDAFTGTLLPICFMITAVLLISADFFAKKRREEKEFSYKSAFVMGVFQGFAMLPGISRSGSTIAGGMLMGENKKETATFSFLMSIPIIIASLLFEILEFVIRGDAIIIDWAPFTLAFIVAFLAGLLAIKFMLKIVEKSGYKWFSAYLVVIAIISLIF